MFLSGGKGQASGRRIKKTSLTGKRPRHERLDARAVRDGLAERAQVAAVVVDAERVEQRRRQRRPVLARLRHAVLGDPDVDPRVAVCCCFVCVFLFGVKVRICSGERAVVGGGRHSTQQAQHTAPLKKKRTAPRPS